MRNPLRPVADWMINILGGVTFSQAVGIEQVFITELDKAREQREAMAKHIDDLEQSLIDIKETRLIAQSVPDEVWNVASMRHEMERMAGQLNALTEKAEQRRRRAREAAAQRQRDINGRFLST